MNRSPSRREFLAFAPTLVVAPVRKPSLTLGFSTYGLPKLPVSKAVALIASIGFDSLELAILPDRDSAPTKLVPAMRKAVRNQLGDSGLKLTALMESVTPSASWREQARTLDRLRRAADLAWDLSPVAPPLIETVLGGGTWNEIHGLYRDRLGDWLRVLAARKIVLAIKPHRFGAMDRPSFAIELIRELRDLPWLRVAFDASHYELRDLDLGKIVAETAARTAFVAVKDVELRAGKAAFLLPGANGTPNHARILGQLFDAGYRGDVNCEVSGMLWGQKGFDAETAARTCYVNMAKATKGLRQVRERK